MSVGEALSIVSSVVSFFLGAFSVWLALYFYKETKNTEKEITNSLSKIETQTAALQKINAKWMDRLIQNATDASPSATEAMFPQLVTILAELPKTITSHISPNANESSDVLREELITSYIAIYLSITTLRWQIFGLSSLCRIHPTSTRATLSIRL